MFIFGSGALIGTPSGANATPVNFGLVNEVSIDESVELKQLYGEGNYPVAIGAGTIKTSGKAKSARVSGLALGSLYYGVTPTAGQTATSYAEAGAIPGASAYTITVSHSATWTADQGVTYAATAIPMKRVASVPTVGQYSVAAGVYTFSAADEGVLVLLSYNYTIPASGTQILIKSKLIGPTINFAMNLYGLDPTTGLGYSLQLYNCVMSKFAFGTKLTDFVMPEFDFEYYANAAGAIGQWNFPDAA
jgi:hypothetical protein